MVEAITHSPPEWYGCDRENVCTTGQISAISILVSEIQPNSILLCVKMSLLKFEEGYRL